MKRFFGFFLFIAVIAGVGYIWWQHNAVRIITMQVQRQAQRFFVNPENITVGPEKISVKLLTMHSARVPKLVISGKQLQLKNGPTLAYAKLVLNDLDIAGPPFRITNVKHGSYVAKVSDSAVTAYLHQRGGNIAGVKIIPLDTVNVKFIGGRSQVTRINGEAVIPYINTRVPIVATGTLVPSSTDTDRVDLRINDVKLTKLNIGIKEVRSALGVLNPVVDLSEWPVSSQVTSVKTTRGAATVAGTISGVDNSLIP